MRCKAYVLLLLLLSGCDRIPGTQAGPSWAVIEKSTIQSAIADSIKEKHPYPPEINDENYKVQQLEYRRLSQQVSDLRTAAMQRCVSQQNSDASTAAPKRQAAAGSPVVTAPSAYWSETPSRASCMQQVGDDQLIADLKIKMQGFNTLEQQRNRHDNMVRKVIQTTIQTATETYARAHGLSLIIDGRSDIAYNQSNQLLDVTQGVVEQILNSSAPR